MTNYNERLDKQLNYLMEYSYKYGKGEIPSNENPPLIIARGVKQAITSLIKELVAEAKLKDYVPEGHEPNACLNHKEYTSACCGCQKQKARNHAIDEFEQNLLKELEEV